MGCSLLGESLFARSQGAQQQKTLPATGGTGDSAGTQRKQRPATGGFGNDAEGQSLLSAVFDNPGKGASGAAVQNLDLMLGLDSVSDGGPAR
jgi:hypothetical protein